MGNDYDKDAVLRWINRKRGLVYRSKWWRVWRRISEWWMWNVEGQG